MALLPVLVVLGAALLWWSHRSGRIRVRGGPLLWAAVFHGVAGMTYLAAILLFPDGRLKPDWSGLTLVRRQLRVAYLAGAFLVAAAWIMGAHGATPSEYIAVFGVLIPVLGLGVAFRGVVDGRGR